MTSFELFRSLSDIRTEALAGMEALQMKTPTPLPRRKPITRGLLIAAMVSILLLLSGCCLYVITRNLNWSKELELDLRPYNEGTDIGILSKNWMLDEAAIELSAAPPVDGTVEITCQEWGLNSEGTLNIGAEYWIEKWNGKTYEEIPTLDKTSWILPEQQVICGTKSSWTVNYREKYGDLEPGNYRIGLMVSKEGQSGELNELGCFAKFRVQETNLVPYLEKFNQAYTALINAEAYHILVTDYYHNQMGDNPVEYEARREEIWKSGNDYLETTAVQWLNQEDFDDSSAGGALMLRSGVGYSVRWAEGGAWDQPISWQTLDFVTETNFTLWNIMYEDVYQSAVDVEHLDGQLNIMEAHDYGGDIGTEYFEIRAFFDSDENLTKLECAKIPGLTYSEEDRILWITVKVLPISPEEAAQLIQSVDVTHPVPFSFAEDQKQMEEDGLAVKTEGFHNTAAQEQVTIDSATQLAKAEVTSKANIIKVFYDKDAKLWKVTFTYSQDDNIYYAVYLDDAGITKMIVSK